MHETMQDLIKRKNKENTAVTSTLHDFTGRKGKVGFLIVNSSLYKHYLTGVFLSNFSTETSKGQAWLLLDFDDAFWCSQKLGVLYSVPHSIYLKCWICFEQMTEVQLNLTHRWKDWLAHETELNPWETLK